VTETSHASDPAAQIKRLQQRIGALEHQQRQATVISALGALMVGGATLVLVGLALPWISTDGSREFGSMTQSGWSAFAAEPEGLLVLLVFLVLPGLTAVTVAGRSAKRHLATHVLADLVCLLPLGMMMSALREGSTVVPRSGCYTILIGALTIAVAALVRRRHVQE
jgi:hypothetical protein